jgi:hypothetical protein
VLRRADARVVLERAHRDVDVRAVAHDRVQERAADAAARVVRLLVAPDEQRLGARDDLELLALDAGERLERRARPGPAVRAVAVGRVQELVPHAVANTPALAPSTQDAYRRRSHHLFDCGKPQNSSLASAAQHNHDLQEVL